MFRASLTGAQENPSVTTSANGTATLVLDPRTRALSGTVTTNGMTGTVAHIHTGAAGSNGGVAIGLTETAAGGGVWRVPANTVLTDAQVASLRSGGLYVNAHSAPHAAGEIREQLNRRIAVATLAGDQEVPATHSTATGRGILAVDPNTRALTGQLTTNGVAGTVAHIHSGAVGVNGGVAVGLKESAPGSGVWNVPANTVLTAAQYKAFLDGALYFNVHSTAFAAGEIRGQIAVN
ncbi:MAG TPA: CHRD domain-containing protein [Burkholderiaceae bacterium]|nr:CHRD domain-containing protein [Burkholderiaceae bacterium]